MARITETTIPAPVPATVGTPIPAPVPAPVSSVSSMVVVVPPVTVATTRCSPCEGVGWWWSSQDEPDRRRKIACRGCGGLGYVVFRGRVRGRARVRYV